ncbi:type II secretion system protein GspD [Persephonella sp.]
MKKITAAVVLAGVVLSGCAEKKPVVQPKPPENDRLEQTLKEIAGKVDRLQSLKDSNQSQFLPDVPGQSPAKKQIARKNVKSDEKAKKVVKLNKKKNPITRYSFTGTNVSLASVISYMFSTRYSIVFDSDVDIQKPITVVINNLPAKQACQEVARRAGYWCEIKNKVVKIKAYRELVYQLPDGIDEFVVETGLGGDILKAGSSTQQMGMMGGGGSSSLSSSGMSARAKVQYKVNLSKDDFEAFLKSFLSDRGEVKVNWFSKTVYIKDTPDRVESLKRFLDETSALLEKSVYIEAKLLLVQTSRSLETGIDWTKIGYITSGTVVGTMTAGLTAPAFQLQYTGNTLSGVISMLSQIGKVRELISPKIRTLNLTPAVLVRGTNEPYVVYSPVSTSTGSGVITQTNTEVRFAFNGISFFIKPYALKDKIFLTLQPSISSIGDYLTFTDSQGNTMKIPKTSITSQITKLKMKNDSTIILGGLVWDGKKKTSTGIPLLDSIPLFGRLFKSDLDANSKIYVMLAVYAKIDKEESQ